MPLTKGEQRILREAIEHAVREGAGHWIAHTLADELDLFSKEKEGGEARNLYLASCHTQELAEVLYMKSV